jgi:hypothetical protein
MQLEIEIESFLVKREDDPNKLKILGFRFS